MSTQALIDAVYALLPTSWPHHKGEVTGTAPTLPWIVSNIGVPDDAHTSEGAHVSAGDLDVYMTVAGANETAARIVLDAVVDSLAGKQPQAVGWMVGALVQYQRPRIYPTDVNLAGTSRHLFTGVVGYRATCSRSV